MTKVRKYTLEELCDNCFNELSIMPLTAGMFTSFGYTEMQTKYGNILVFKETMNKVYNILFDMANSGALAENLLSTIAFQTKYNVDMTEWLLLDTVLTYARARDVDFLDIQEQIRKRELCKERSLK